MWLWWPHLSILLTRTYRHNRIKYLDSDHPRIFVAFNFYNSNIYLENKFYISKIIKGYAKKLKTIFLCKQEQFCVVQATLQQFLTLSCQSPGCPQTYFVSLPLCFFFCYSFELENIILCIIILFCVPHLR